MGVTVAIHQPNFLPWQGFFDKWIRADVLVLLDDVQFPKSGGNWTNRCGILQSGKATWLTVPVSRNYSGTRAIAEIECRNSDGDSRFMTSKISAAYATAPFFSEVLPIVGPAIQSGHTHILGLNLAILNVLSEQMNLPANRIVLSSSLGLKSMGTERLCDITRAVGGDTYLSGLGAYRYQDVSLFGRRDIRLEFQSFTEMHYQQIGVEEFVPGLSILDALMNIGFEQTARRLSHSSQT